MLLSLHIENIAIIERCDVDFNSGFNVITGETGAGKSIIIDSINLIMGNKASKSIIRTGATYALVSAVFSDFNIEQAKKLSEFDIFPDEDGNVFVSRRISIDGKNVTKINGIPVTVSLLKEISYLFVDIHGQQDGAYILNPASHVTYLDEFASNESLISDYAENYSQIKKLRDKITELTEVNEKKEQLEVLLKSKIDELEYLKIQPGELEKLKEAAKCAHNRSKIESSLSSCSDILSGDEVGVLSSLRNLYDEVSPLKDTFSEFLNVPERIEKILIELQDISDTISKKHSEYDEFDYSPEQIESRIFEISAVVKKYGDEQKALDALLSFKDQLAHLEDNAAELEEVSNQYKRALKQLEDSALKLSQSRIKAGELLAKNITAELKTLDMPNINFVVDIKRNVNTRGGNKYSIYGFDKIEFLLSANIGETPKPLAKIASGGELSRIMLCLKTVLTGTKNGCSTLIYDEIDTGVSGSTAEKIGLKLKKSSINHQVFTVTHLAQIAALADNHFKVEKHNDNEKTVSSIRLLDCDERIQEVARIMGGVDISEKLLASAKELINNAKKC